MTMPTIEGGRPIARFRLLGFPVTVDISFVVVAALLGWLSEGTVTGVVVWLLVVPVAVLVHELGHAAVARTTGAAPTITLAGLGGLTSYAPPRPLSRARSVAISVAGPAVGIAIGAPLYAYILSTGAPDGLVGDVLDVAVFVTLFWSVANLLPILPLDGGQTLRELLPGSPARREVRAAVVSVVTAVVVGLGAWRAGYVFGVVFVAFLAVSNVMTVRNARDLDKVDVNQRLVRLMWSGQPAAARDLLADQPTGRAVHPLVRAAVRATTDDPEGGRGELELAVQRQPDDGTASSMLVLVHRVREDWAAVRDVVAQHRSVDPGSVLAAQTVAFRTGARRASADIGQAWLDRLPPGAAGGELPGLIAYNAACGWVGAGDLDRGLAAFRRAADLGFADLTTVDSDDDIAPLRPLPGYDEARQQIRRRALAALEPGEHPGTPG